MVIPSVLCYHFLTLQMYRAFAIASPGYLRSTHPMLTMFCWRTGNCSVISNWTLYIHNQQHSPSPLSFVFEWLCNASQKHIKILGLLVGIYICIYIYIYICNIDSPTPLSFVLKQMKLVAGIVIHVCVQVTNSSSFKCPCSRRAHWGRWAPSLALGHVSRFSHSRAV